MACQGWPTFLLSVPIYVTSFSVFHSEATVSIGLKNVYNTFLNLVTNFAALLPNFFLGTTNALTILEFINVVISIEETYQVDT